MKIMSKIFGYIKNRFLFCVQIVLLLFILAIAKIVDKLPKGITLYLYDKIKP